MSHFRKILCPVDFSTASLHALEQAVQLCARDDTQLDVLHVLADQPAASRPLTPEETLRQACTGAEAVRKLCSLVADQVPAHIRSRPLLKRGDVAAEILNTAREEGTELIVMTTPGSGLTENHTGDIARAVKDAAACPVLSVGCPLQARPKAGSAPPSPRRRNGVLRPSKTIPQAA